MAVTVLLLLIGGIEADSGWVLGIVQSLAGTVCAVAVLARRSQATTRRIAFATVVGLRGSATLVGWSGEVGLSSGYNSVC